MDKTRSMTRNQTRNSASTKKKRFKTFDKGSSAPWSDLNHHVLYLVMMQLGILGFLAFSGVCKSWRALAHSNKKRFMASIPPMSMMISNHPYKKECCLEDFDGRKLKTLLPHSAKRACVGLTCGYLILFSWRNYDYWLVNPITRHQLYFPCLPSRDASDQLMSARAVLVFSPSVSGWVFVTSHISSKEIWFSTAGQQGAWNCVKSKFPILDLHAFKGKIYTLNTRSDLLLGELSLNPEPKVTLLETKNLPNPCMRQEFVSSGENLFVVQSISEQECKVHELDIGEMKWMLHEKTTSEFAFFLSFFKASAAVRSSLWSRRFADTLLSEKVRRLGKGCSANMWFFPHDCFNVNRLEV